MAPDKPPQALAPARQQRARRMAREASREPRRPERALVERGAGAGPQSLRGAVEALARARDDGLASRQRAGDRPEIAAQPLGEAQDRAPRPAVEVRERGDELGANGRREFGRRGRRRRAQIRRVVDQRPVGLVADRGDQRDRAARGGAHHALVVEAHEVLERAAAARDDQHVRPRRRAVRRAAR